jgi:3-hydroxy-9,10-secoandrosta-1,3,5(10)-triene-9,17-dione monooxygenase
VATSAADGSGSPIAAMPERPTDRLSSDEAIARARALAPAFRERAAETEALRRLPDAALHELMVAGLCGILQPAAWGGSELDLRTFLEVGTQLGRGDPAAAWSYTVTESHFWILSLFPEEAQRDVWGERSATLASTATEPTGMRPERVAGGYRVRGRASFSSGCDHGEWVIVGGTVPPAHADTPPERKWFLLPGPDYEIDDDWYTLGMRGTGSKSIVVAEAFVPEHRTVNVRDLFEGTAPGRAVHSGPLYRTPLVASWPVTFLGPTLGAALGLSEAWQERARTRFKAFEGAVQAETVAAQLRLAESYAQIDAARTLLRRDVDEVMAVVGAREQLTPFQRARIRMGFGWVLKTCIEAADRLFAASGGGSIYDGSPLQRYWRDLHTIGAHRVLDWDTAAEEFGRAALDLPASTARWRD